MALIETGIPFKIGLFEVTLETGEEGLITEALGNGGDPVLGVEDIVLGEDIGATVLVVAGTTVFLTAGMDVGASGDSN